jgi:hypothetical protein
MILIRWVLLVWLVSAMPAMAAGKVSLSAERAAFAGLRVSGLRIQWAPGAPSRGQLALHAGRIEGIAATGPLSKLSIDCAELEVSGDLLNCAKGRLTGTLGSLGGQNTRFRARTRKDGSAALRLETFALAGGRARVHLTLRGKAWEIDSAVSGVDVAALAKIAKPWLEPPAGLTVGGNVSGRVQATGREDEPRTIHADLALERIDFADQSGALAGEAVAGRIALTLAADRSGGYTTDGRLELSAGQAYREPVFLDFGQHAVELDFEGTLAPDASGFEARSFSLMHQGVANVSGSARLDFAAETLLQKAEVRIAELDLASALPAYAQPFLVATAFKDIAGSGRIRGELDIESGLPSRAVLTLEDVTLDSQTGSLSASGLGGNLNWYDDALHSKLAGKIDDAAFQSRLAWNSARLWGLEIGAVELPFSTSGRHFRLLEPEMLPIFDGGLAIVTLRVRHAGTDQMYVRFDAELRPISIALLSRALGWPEFSGTVAGSIPDLQMSGGVVTLGGNLEAEAFDGRIVVRELRLRDPLGQYPRLHASIDVENLDLELVTNTFSFGTITGRLSGRIEDLETFGWMPESFDARFYTPPDDRSPHVLSQRAVSNLSSIGGGSGGGVTAALQGGFLKFFDTFRYDRLGLSCRLANDVCTMGGVEPSSNGYYIIKGAGLPRIDVVSSQRQVAWTRLVRQLVAAINEESEIVVK